MIVYAIQEIGGNNNSQYSLNVMVNYHYHSENGVITCSFPSMPGASAETQVDSRVELIVVSKVGLLLEINRYSCD